MLSILVLVLIFIKLKNNLLKDIQNLIKTKDKEFNKLINELNNTVYKQLIVVKKEFETTQELQKMGITELVKFNQFLKEIPQKIEDLNSAVAQRTQFEHEITRLKKIIKRREKNV
jgi:hypothetical protein